MASNWKVTCAKCKTDSDSLKRCTGCFQVYYCSPDCQRSHWRDHKTKCNRTNRPGTKPTTQGQSSSTLFHQSNGSADNTQSAKGTSMHKATSDVQRTSSTPERTAETPTHSGAGSSSSCNACKKVVPSGALKKCAACKLVKYCSKKCQTSDWKLHKPNCVQIETIKTEGAKQSERETFLRRQGMRSPSGPVPVTLSPLHIMMGRMSSFPEKERPMDSFNRAIQVARKRFPATTIVDDFDDIPHEFLFGPIVQSRRALLAYIFQMHGHFQRHGVYIKDKEDAVTHVLFYLDYDSPFPFFTWDDVRPGRYICIKDPKIHNFVDGTVGLRIDEPAEISFIDV